MKDILKVTVFLLFLLLPACGSPNNTPVQPEQPKETIQQEGETFHLFAARPFSKGTLRDHQMVRFTLKGQTRQYHIWVIGTELRTDCDMVGPQVEGGYAKVFCEGEEVARFLFPDPNQQIFEIELQFSDQIAEPDMSPQS